MVGEIGRVYEGGKESRGGESRGGEGRGGEGREREGWWEGAGEKDENKTLFNSTENIKIINIKILNQ